MRFPIRTITALAAFMTTTALSACSSDLTTPSDPGSGDPAQSSPAAVLDSALGGGSSRIEIKLFPGELVAREVHLEADDNEEKIVSNVTAIDEPKIEIHVDSDNFQGVSGGAPAVLRVLGLTIEVNGRTLESTADAVTAGRPVRAEGRGTVESAGPPAVISATSLKVEVDH